MKDGVAEILYYRGPKNQVGVSFDEGETLVIPSGRRLPVSSLWEETDEDGLESMLTQAQAEAMAEFRAKPPLTAMEQMVWEMRRRRQRVACQYAQPKAAPRTILESAKVVVSELDD